MTTHELEQQLTTCIRDALRMRTFSRPRTPDTSVTDRFYVDMACALLERMKADGWSIQPAGHLPANAEDDLQFCMRVSLSRYPLRRPQSRNVADVERYYGSVADAVVKAILRSNWRLVRTLQKMPPRALHSTPPYHS